MYIADKMNNRIRKVAASSGIISTFAGTGIANYTGDYGAATSMALNQPTEVALDSAGNYVSCAYCYCHSLIDATLQFIGNVYISDSENSLIRKVNISNGIITTIFSYPSPTAIALDSSGRQTYSIKIELLTFYSSIDNVYFFSYGTYAIFKIEQSGNISTFAGTGTQGYSGDGGASTSAELYGASGIAVDTSGIDYTIM